MLHYYVVYAVCQTGVLYLYCSTYFAYIGQYTTAELWLLSVLITYFDNVPAMFIIPSAYFVVVVFFVHRA